MNHIDSKRLKKRSSVVQKEEFHGLRYVEKERKHKERHK